MDFSTVASLIRDLNEAREDKRLAELRRDLAHAEGKASTELEEAVTLATDKWFERIQAVEAAWEVFLKPYGVTRHELRMAAL